MGNPTICIASFYTLNDKMGVEKVKRVHLKLLLVSCFGGGGGSSSSNNTNPRKWIQTQQWISNIVFPSKFEQH